MHKAAHPARCLVCKEARTRECSAILRSSILWQCLELCCLCCLMTRHRLCDRFTACEGRKPYLMVVPDNHTVPRNAGQCCGQILTVASTTTAAAQLAVSLYNPLRICRIYCHMLMVLDDEDFYNLQSTFTVSQQRGISTALNTLVFRTHCPATSGKL